MSAARTLLSAALTAAALVAAVATGPAASHARADDAAPGDLLEALLDDLDEPTDGEVGAVMYALVGVSGPCFTAATDALRPLRDVPGTATPALYLTPLGDALRCVRDVGARVLDGEPVASLDPADLSRKQRKALAKGVRALGPIEDDAFTAAGTGGTARVSAMRRLVNHTVTHRFYAERREDALAGIGALAFVVTEQAVRLETDARIREGDDLLARYAALAAPPARGALKRALKSLGKAVSDLGGLRAEMDALLARQGEIDEALPSDPADDPFPKSDVRAFVAAWKRLMNRLAGAVRALDRAVAVVEDALADLEPPPGTLPDGFFAAVTPGRYHASSFGGPTLDTTGTGLDLLDETTNWSFTHRGHVEIGSREALWDEIRRRIDAAEADLEDTFGPHYFHVVTSQGGTDWEQRVADFAARVRGATSRTWTFSSQFTLTEGLTAIASYTGAPEGPTTIALFFYVQPPAPQAFLDLPPGDYLVQPMLRDCCGAVRDVVVGGRTVAHADPTEFWDELVADLTAQEGSLESLFRSALDPESDAEQTLLDDAVRIVGTCPAHFAPDFGQDADGTWFMTHTFPCGPSAPQDLRGRQFTLFVKVTPAGT